MPTSSSTSMVLVNILLRSIAGPLLHPVVYVDVARAVAGSVGQYAFARHLLVVRRDRARLDVRSTGGALERRLQTATDQTDRRGRIAADAMELAVGSSLERHNMGLTVWRDDRYGPCHRVAIRTRDLAHQIIRRRLAGWQSGLRPVPVPPADERAALSPPGTGGQRDTKSHDDCGPSNSSHCALPLLQACEETPYAELVLFFEMTTLDTCATDAKDLRKNS